MDVAEWLRGFGLEQYASTFRENGIDARVLPKLTAEDLKDLGIAMVGHRRILLEAIAALRDSALAPSVTAHSEPAAANRERQAGTEAERRQVTVMFCDLVGSTALSAKLDPEDLREVLGRYHACVAETVYRFNGFVAKYMGDGVLVYFGYPHAHEDDPEQAVRAGLALVDAVSELGALERLQVRIGIATGLVVVGDLIGAGSAREQAIVGETPNLAARLQALAEPDAVIIAERTRRQTGLLFEFTDLGPQSLKGFAEPQPAWRVIGENRALGRFEALRSRTTPLIGREQELELLLGHWAQAKAGSGRVVLIDAEPGIGKSRLAEALAERIAGELHIVLRYFCSSHHQDSALYPVIAHMERAAGFSRDDALETKLKKLEALLGAAGSLEEKEAPRPLQRHSRASGNPGLPGSVFTMDARLHGHDRTEDRQFEQDVALIAELHGLQATELAPALDMTSQKRKEKTFEALLRHLDHLSRRQTLLMVFEDIHWIDPSSRELLDRTVERIAELPVLLLATFRPEFQPPWTGHPHVTMLMLARLDRRDTAAMVANIAGDSVLTTDMVQEIAERTDGVPLFVEELTKSVLESGAQRPAALAAMADPALSVPATLHALLMARLDRLGTTAKDAAQKGAVIGREFEYDLLSFIAELPEPELREALDRLTNSGLLFARGRPPRAEYTFKHALVQDAAYGTLLRRRRQQLHALIAKALEEQFPDTALRQPAMLARHCTEAGLVEQAISYCLKAGQQLLARSAMAEAAAELRKGLELLGGLPDGLWRQQQEFQLLSALVSVLSATKGWSASEVSETIARTRAVAERIDQPEYLVPLIMGQWTFHLVRGEHRLASALAKRLEEIGESRNHVAAQWLAYSCHGITSFVLGELVPARVVLEQFRRLTDSADRALEGFSFDPYAITLTWLGLSLTYLGHVDQGRMRMEEALAEARRLKHAHTLAHVLLFTNWLEWIVHSPMMHTEEVLALTTEHGFPHYHGWALAYHGRALISLGQPREGLTLLRRGVAELRATGNVVSTPMALTWLAEAHAVLGETAEEESYFGAAAQVIEATEERVSMAELLHRVRGDLLKARGDRAAAEQHYRQALGIAERLSAKLLELHAATSLARLWHEDGKRQEAHDILTPIYDWFTEGFDSPPLTEARALLDRLSSCHWPATTSRRDTSFD